MPKVHTMTARLTCKNTGCDFTTFTPLCQHLHYLFCNESAQQSGPESGSAPHEEESCTINEDGSLNVPQNVDCAFLSSFVAFFNSKSIHRSSNSLHSRTQTLTELHRIITLFDIVSILKEKTSANTVLKLFQVLQSFDTSMLSAINTIERLTLLHQSEILTIDSDLQTPTFDPGPLFKKNTIRKGNMRYHYWSADPVDLLRRQISIAKHSEICTSPASNMNESNAMTGTLGKSSFDTIARLIKDSDNATWFSRHDNLLDYSTVGYGQIYSDSSQTTLNSKGLTFHPLHLTLLNFSNNFRKTMISNGLSIVAYLPTSYEELVERSGEYKWVRCNSLDRKRKNNFLTECINLSLAKLRECAFPGFTTSTVDGYQLHVHFVPAHYSADIPEAKDLLGIKHGQLTKYPCFRCHILNTDLILHELVNPRSILETGVIESYQNGCLLLAESYKETNFILSSNYRTTARSFLDEHSMHHTKPLFHDWPFVGIVHELDPYNMFSVEPLHLLHLGVSKMLKQCMCDRLRDDTILTSAMTKKLGAQQQISKMRLRILRQMNKLIDSVTSNSNGLRIGSSLRRDDGKSNLNGFFNDDGISGMMEGSVFKQIDRISPFLAALVDRCCDEHDNCPTTRVFCDYVELLHKFDDFSSLNPGSLSILSQLHKSIQSFKSHAVNVFGKYQKSTMGTLKWHLLDHICEDMNRLGSMIVCDAGIYEQSHKLFKYVYNTATNKRQTTALEHTINTLGERINGNAEHVCKKRRILSPSELGDYTNTENAKNIVPVLCRPYTTARLLHLGSITRNESDNYNIPKNTDIIALQNSIGPLAMKTLVTCLFELLTETGLDDSIAHQISVAWSRSCYLPGYSCPTNDMTNDQGIVSIDRSTPKYGTKIVCNPIYYGSHNGRFDSVIIRHKCSSVNNIDVDELWFGQVLSFVTLSSSTTTDKRSGKCTLHNATNCERCRPKFLGSYAFVQYYDVIPESELPLDGIERRLNCIRLKWTRTHQQVDRDIDSGKEYGLCPLESLLGMVHVVPTAEITNALGVTNKYKKQTLKCCGPTNRWEGELFYVNRFFKTAMNSNYESE